MSERGRAAVQAYWASVGVDEKRRHVGLMKAATRRRYCLPDGAVFGRWIIKKYHGPDGYVCLCVCGHTAVVRRRSLVTGESQSCGCLSRERRRAQGRDSALEGNLRALFCATQIRARRQHHPWRISLHKFRALIFAPCLYCGVSGTNHKKSARKDTAGDFYYNGLDRVDSTRGYVPSNVVPCCKVCNRAKSDMTQADFHAWISQLVSYTTKGVQ